ncbi:unnamed protein product [Spirodela intermedia]|uniref:Uncharacterized protein n=1 Tax=Spirodela intermedia TaxID=51605 RepID=A0A7I8JNG6_SPIIN|nr:unnamed protein product [Spirodela intermedia]CAA6671696.1 unnamed protein product [Spirodela intermedia]
MGATTKIASLKVLFIVLDCIVTATIVYTLITDGLPSRKDLLTPWMTATLIDFYIIVVPIAIWVACKESSWISRCVWIILLICLGSITTCTYILLKLFKESPQDSTKEPIYSFLQNRSVRNGNGRGFSSVVVGRIVFAMLACLMLATLIYTCLTDGSPFRKELLTPWMTALLVQFYVNVAAIAVWVTYKESTWTSALIWIIFFICFGRKITEQE